MGVACLALGALRHRPAVVRDRLPHLLTFPLQPLELLRFCFLCALCERLPQRILGSGILPPALRFDKREGTNEASVFPVWVAAKNR